MTKFKKRGLLFLAVPVVVFIIFVVLNMMSNADFEYAVELSWGYGALPAFVFWPLGLYTMFRKDPALLTPEQKKKERKLFLGLSSIFLYLFFSFSCLITPWEFFKQTYGCI